MTIEGNWITGAMQNDFPDLDYQVVRCLPGPRRRPSSTPTAGAWPPTATTSRGGLAGRAPHHAGAADGVRRRLRRDALRRGGGRRLEGAVPGLAPFIDSAEFAKNLPAAEGSADVLAEMNAQLATLKDSDPQQILEGVQQNMEAVLSN